MSIEAVKECDREILLRAMGITRLEVCTSLLLCCMLNRINGTRLLPNNRLLGAFVKHVIKSPIIASVDR